MSNSFGVPGINAMTKSQSNKGNADYRKNAEDVIELVLKRKSAEEIL